MSPFSQRPDYSVILVSDYAASDEGVWDKFRDSLHALAAQTYRGNVEYLLVEHEENMRRLPDDLRGIVNLRTVAAPKSESFAMKNLGVQHATAPRIMILDGDCLPGPEWLAGIDEAWRQIPAASVISGRTRYQGRTLTERLLSLLSRAYVDSGADPETTHISNNNATWRRDVFLAHPLPEGIGPFAARIQSESVCRAGHLLHFSSAFPVIHDYDGWSREGDLRKNCGYGTVIARLRDPQMSFASLIRMGRVSIPFIWAGKTLHLWKDTLRCHGDFAIRLHEMPLALALAPILVAMEIPGMLTAFARRQLATTEFR